jgi:hypothetical protein
MAPLFSAGKYEIHVRGQIPAVWADAFCGMVFSVQQIDGEMVTTLAGEVSDQACLQGILQNLYSLGLELLYLQQGKTVENRENSQRQ